MSAEQFVGASNHRLFADWNAWTQEPEHVWRREFRTLAARAVSLVSNDPFAAAMVAAKLRETHGPRGMMLRSAYQERGGVTTSAQERQRRRDIESLLGSASAGTALDACGMSSRLDIERQLDWLATVMGDAWAVWVWKPGRPGAQLAGCWRVISPERVCNPDDRPDDDRLQSGCELDADGHVVAIHVREGSTGAFGYRTKSTWLRVPIFAEDGQRIVIHRRGMTLPGMIRGISMFAPSLMLMRQVQGTLEAHVQGKRAQACHPIVYQTDDETELATALANKARLGANAAIGPLSVLVARHGAADVKFMQSQFQGSDLSAFLTTMYRSLSAMWGLPWQVVLASMGEASLASARAGLDQADRTCEAFAAEHEHAVSRVMDEAILREAQARGMIDFGAADWPWIMAGRYSRPPKYSTDRQKDAATIGILIRDARVAPTTAHALFGLSYEDEVEQAVRDREFALAQGLPDPLTAAAPVAPVAADHPSDQPADPAAETATDLEPVPA